MDQHPSSNDVPHLQLLGHQLEGRPATAVRCDGAKVPCWLRREGEKRRGRRGGGEEEGEKRRGRRREGM